MLDSFSLLTLFIKFRIMEMNTINKPTGTNIRYGVIFIGALPPSVILEAGILTGGELSNGTPTAKGLISILKIFLKPSAVPVIFELPYIGESKNISNLSK